MAATAHHRPGTRDALDRATAQDPHAPAGSLMVLAANHPDLRPAIAGNPACPPELREWIAQQGAPGVRSTGTAGDSSGPSAADRDSLAPLGWEPSDLDLDEDPFGSVLGDPLMGSPLFDEEATAPRENDPAASTDRSRSASSRPGGPDRRPRDGYGSGGPVRQGAGPTPAAPRAPAPQAPRAPIPAAVQRPAPRQGHAGQVAPGAPAGPYQPYGSYSHDQRPGVQAGYGLPPRPGAQAPDPFRQAAHSLGALVEGIPGAAGVAGRPVPGATPAGGGRAPHPPSPGRTSGETSDSGATSGGVPKAAAWAALIGLIILIRNCAG